MKYKESDIPWIGTFPAHWEKHALARVTIDRCDGPFGSRLKSEHYSHCGARVVRLQNIGFARFRGKDEAFIDLGYFSRELKKHEVREGDLLIAGLGDDRNLVGRACVAPSGVEPALVKADCFRYRLNKDRALSKFLAYQLSVFAIGARSFSTGSTRARMNLSTTSARAVVLPPLKQQQEIAAFLDRETARIGDLIDEKQRLLELLEEKRTALITRAVTKGLDPSVPMKDSGVEWLGEIPCDWKLVPNLALFERRDERGFPDLPILNVSIHSGVTIRQFANDRIEQQAEDRGIYKRALKGDIAFNKMRMWQGAVGAVPEDGLVSPDYTVARARKDADPDFYELLFRTKRFQIEVDRHSYGMVKDRNRLYWGRFKRILSPQPPLEEQKEIVSGIRKMTETILDLISEVKAAIELLKEYRTALISAAVTGKIDVRERMHEADQ